MKKVSTAAARQIRNFSQQKLTMGLDLGDRSSCYRVLDEAGTVRLEQLSTSGHGQADCWFALHKQILLPLASCRLFLPTFSWWVCCSIHVLIYRKNKNQFQKGSGDGYPRT